MNWQPTVDGYHCDLHGEDFRRAEVCSRCASDPGAPPGVVQSGAEIDSSIMADAGRYSSNAKMVWRIAAELLEGTERDASVGGKLSDCAIKWERLALEAKDKVAARKHLRDAMAHERDMRGRRGHN